MYRKCTCRFVNVHVCLCAVSNTHAFKNWQETRTLLCQCKLLIQQCFYMLWQPPLHTISVCKCTYYICNHELVNCNNRSPCFPPKWINSLLCKLLTLLVAVQLDSVKLAWNLFLFDTAEIYLLWIYCSWINVSLSAYHLWTEKLILI